MAPRHPRVLRWSCRSIAVIALSLAFLSMAIAGAVLHIAVPAGQKFVAHVANGVLASTIPGRIEIRSIGTVGIECVSGATVAVLDPAGKRVLFADGLSACIDLPALVAFLRGRSPTVRVEKLEASYVEVDLARRGDELRIVSAFKSTEEKAGPPGRRVEVEMPNVAIRHGWVHGHPSRGLPVDGEVDRLTGSVFVTPEETTVSIAGAHLLARQPLSENIVEATLRGTLEVGEQLALETRARGRIDRIPFRARARIEDDDVRATLRIPRTSAEDLRSVIPAYRGTAAASAAIEVSGSLAYPEVDAKFDVGEGRLRVHGRGDLADPFAANVRIAAEKIDLAKLSPALPRLTISLRGKIRGTWREGQRHARADLRIQPFQARGQRVPATDIEVTLANRRLELTSTIHQSGLPVNVSAWASLGPDLAAPEAIRFRVSTQTEHPRAVAPFGPVQRASGTISARGRLELNPPVLSAEASAELRHVKVGPVRARTMSLDARAEGPIDKLQLRGNLSARDVELDGRSFDGLTARARGNLADLRVSARLRGPKESAVVHARIDAVDGVNVRNIRVRGNTEGSPVDVEVDNVRFEDGTIRVDEITLGGAGEAKLKGHWGRERKRLEGRLHEVELGTLTRFFGGSEIMSGTVSGDVDIEANGRLSGSVDLRFRDLRTRANVPPLRGILRADFEESGLDAVAVVRAQKEGIVRLQSKNLLLGRSWASFLEDLPSSEEIKESATGTAELYLHGHSDFVRTQAQRWVRLSLSRNDEGRIVLGLRFARDRKSELPDIDLYAATTGSALAFENLESEGSSAAPSRFDLQSRWRVTRATGQGRVDARISDAQGTVASLSAMARVADVWRVWPPERPTEPVENMPLLARLTLFERDLRALPGPLSIDGLTGKVRASAYFTGTLRHPNVMVDASLSKLGVVRSRSVHPLDVRARATYANEQGAFEATVSQDARRVLDLEGDVQADLRAWLVDERQPKWSGSATARLSRFPLHSIALLDEYEVGGWADGTLVLENWGQDAALHVRLQFEEPRIGRIPFEKAEASLRIADAQLEAEARMVQPEGRANVTFRAPSEWGSRPFPSLGTTESAELTATAENFRIGFLMPFVQSALSKLDGRVDANLKVVKGTDPEIRGRVRLSDGTVQLPAIGQEFDDVNAELIADGRGNVTLVDAKARGLTGELSLSGKARVEGLALRRAQARLIVHKGDELPLTIQGVSYGTGWGRVDVAANFPENDGTGVLDVRVNRFHLELPDNPTRNVQGLGPAPKIETGVYKVSGEFKDLPLQLIEKDEEEADETPWLVHLKLGNDVWVRQSNKVEVRLAGTPDVILEEDARVEGQIRIPEGYLDVLGKRFEIDEGFVTFRDDPSNPEIYVRARWESPEGVMILAEYRGHAGSGDVELSSNPAFTDSEILSILLFGTPEGSVGAASTTEESGQLAGGAAGVGSGIATAGLNRALSDLSDVEITTRVDTSEAGTARPEVAVQVSRRLAVQVGYNIAPSPTSRTPDHALLTLILRLGQKWSLESTLGDAGSSSMDLIWWNHY